MLDKSKFWLCVVALLPAACATPEPQVAQPPPAPAAASATAVVPPTPRELEKAATAEASALLAQAETDIQRARSRRALWLKAWEDLVAARQALAANDPVAASRHARRASELALLGLEQLAYPAVR